MADEFGGLDWWDVPADYLGGSGSPLDFNTDFGNFGGGGFGDVGVPGAGLGAGGDQWVFDTVTGQVITAAQAQEIDPNYRFTGTGSEGDEGKASPFDWKNALKLGIGGATALGGLGALGLGIGSLFGGSSPANRTTTQTSAAGQGPRTPEAQALLGSPGLVGTGAGGTGGGPGTGLLGLSDLMIRNLGGSPLGGAPASPQGVLQAPGTQIGQISEMPGGVQTRPNLGAPFAPAVRQFNETTGQYDYTPGYGPSPGGGAMALPQQRGPMTWTPPPGRDDLSAPTGTGGQVFAGQPQAAQQAPAQQGQPGLIGQQSNILGGLQNQIPQLNPAIMQALGIQAGGMAQGYLPSLSDPQAQARIQSIYQPGFDALNYNAGLALSNAREQLQQRGFQAPDIREGPTQALTAPILAAQQLGRSQLYGQMAGAQLDLASRLPMLASQLNAQNYSTQAQPFGLGMQLAGAYNQPIATQGQFPLSLLDILERGRGSTSTINTVGPQPSLTQQLGQLAPIVGAGGSLLSSAGQTLFPQTQNPYGFKFDPFTGASLSGV